MTDRNDLAGSKLGEFVLCELIDEGGFGQVYRCEQPTLGREAVVKLLHCRLRDQDVQLQRFFREAQLASRLDHPYAAHIYGFGIDEGQGLLWIAMEYVHGITLKRWLSERGPMAIEQFVPFFEHVAEVVQTAHERGIVHRDLKLLLITHDDDRDSTMLPVSTSGIDAVGFLPDGRAIAADARGRLQVYDAHRGALLAVLEMQTRVRLLRPSSDGLRLITIPSHAGRPSPPLLWDLARYRLIARLDGHGDSGRVFSARFFDLDREIGTVGNDGTVRLWDAATGRLLNTYRAKSRFLADVAVDAAGSVVMAGGSDGVLWFWDRATARPVWTLRAHKSHVVGVHLEGDGFVTRGFGGDVSRWTLPRMILGQVLETCDTERAGCGSLPR